MTSEKKCPQCGQWTKWNKNPEDRCAHCDSVLDPRRVQEKIDVSTREAEDRAHSFFIIRPQDGLPMKAIRRTAFVAHAVYAAIVWLFLVLFASTPG
ncbi:MAG: hypothetical protein K9J06_08740 [Flavobacteriales bacterium]|nr:hypothetical protein [Flavobacteriales bacterium]